MHTEPYQIQDIEWAGDIDNDSEKLQQSRMYRKVKQVEKLGLERGRIEGNEKRA